MPSAARAVAGLLGSALLLGTAACGSDGPAESASSSRSQGEVRASQAADDTAHNDADVRFAQEMAPHHGQAVEMVALTEGHDLDPDVRALADGIGGGQGREIDLMTGWLQGWGEEVPAAGADMAMEGMLSDDEMDQLRTAEDPAFQRLWLTQMTQHHRGAIPMAETELADGKFPVALDLAARSSRRRRPSCTPWAG